MNDRVQRVTTELSGEMLRDILKKDDTLPSYIPVPHMQPGNRPVWRVRFDPTFDSQAWMGLDINDEVALGRAQDSPDAVTLFSPQAAEQLGVSRRHAMLRPTESKLYIIDLDSTNGTWLNGRAIGANMPHSLANGDRVLLGRLEFVVTIIRRPSGHTATLRSQADIGDILPEIACAITAQLDRESVLAQALGMIVAHTDAAEASCWLVNEHTGELLLEAGQGLEDGQVRRIPLDNTLPGEVIATGKPLRANREDGEQIKLKTGYLVEAVIYVPLKLAGVTFGVLSAVHHEQGRMFNHRQERIMRAIADFTAVAIQNARTHEAATRMLNRRSKVITALRYALSVDLKQLVKANTGYAGMLAADDTLDPDSAEIAAHIRDNADASATLVDRLVEVTTLCEDPNMRQAPCDLLDIVTRAAEELFPAIQARGQALDFDVGGAPYLIYGDETHLYRSAYNLLDNAMRFAPDQGHIEIALDFGEHAINFTIRDDGPGIAPEDLPHLFDRYYRRPPGGGEPGGLGLGLELVRATAEAHRGTIHADNHDRGGAIFVMSLPASLRAD